MFRAQASVISFKGNHDSHRSYLKGLSSICAINSKGKIVDQRTNHTD